jgi:hypothetical protein
LEEEEPLKVSLLKRIKDLVDFHLVDKVEDRSFLSELVEN